MGYRDSEPSPRVSRSTPGVARVEYATVRVDPPAASRGLTEDEAAELAELQATADHWLEPIDRQRLDLLRPYEELAQRLTQQSAG